MRVNGHTKPKGAMKVKGERSGVLVAPAALSGADPRPADAAAVIPYQSGANEGGARRDETLSPAPPLVPWVTRGALDGPSPPGLACTQGGAGPGLAMRRRRANLLLTSPALLGLSVGGPRVFGRVPSGGGAPASLPRGSSGAVPLSDPALSGVA